MTTNLVARIVLTLITNWVSLDETREIGVGTQQATLQVEYEGEKFEKVLKTEPLFFVGTRKKSVVLYINGNPLWTNPLESCIILTPNPAVSNYNVTP